MFDVISIGSATLDVFIKAEDFQILKTDKVITGEGLVVPYGTKSEVKKLVIASGGGGTNTAVGFSRLGLKAAVLARCGWDFAGKIVRKELKKEGVDDSLLLQKENEQTDYSTILIGPDGGASILVYRGGTRLESSQIDFNKQSLFLADARNKFKSRWFCISGLEGNLELLVELVEYARKNKIKVALNPGRREIEQKEELLEIAKEIDVFIVNLEEASQLGIKKVVGFSEGIIAITRGAEGVYLYDGKDHLLASDGFRVGMVDATGAGDGFTCGFVAGLIKGWKLEDALKLGIANGASVVTEIGAKPGLLRQENAHNWLAKPLKMHWKK